MRPKHWIKSGFCLAPLVFIGEVFDLTSWISIFPLIIVFSLVSSGGYVFNDLWNREEDKKHPRKCLRPIASGKITIKQAYYLLAFCEICAAIICWFFYELGSTTITVCAYIVVNLLYTTYFRKIPILDITIISFGFVLRVLAGAFAIGVESSVWLLLLTYLLALLLGLGKRCGEVRLLENEKIKVGATRGVLHWYYSHALILLMRVLLGVTFIVYLMYCLKVRSQSGFWLTIIPVAIGLFAYSNEVDRSTSVESPETMILNRPILTGSLIAWGLMVIWFV